ncbi:MAG: hypothetical protein QG589_571 [Patescibacteria group bacterium]|nr:hypothetical protein [Patescibacteria group bacterium]
MKITICGSIAFYDEMEKAKKILEQLNHEVMLPQLALEVPKEMGGGRKVYFGKFIEENGGMDAFPPDHKIWNMKEGAINDHFKKIEWSDAVLIVNPEKKGIKGYVGGNTLIEIGLTFYHKKPIYILNEVSSELSYKQEILGMKPIVLNGNFDLIQ